MVSSRYPSSSINKIEDSFGPDTAPTAQAYGATVSFRPLTRIHLALTSNRATFAGKAVLPLDAE